ncbi:hypothetical protein L6250_01520 [Candidatus Parcubacteria bacterium]|nr:hypothetical protein [Candidatus Parcubacteria bacterium]
MLNESLALLSLDELKDVLFFDLTILHVALVYILTYVVYKAFGRYVYFKPQEHASKVNRTFLTLSLLVVALYVLSGVVGFLPFLPKYRWLYAVSGLVLLIAPLSILMDRVIWKYHRHGGKSRRDWHYDYLPISDDYYKTNVSKSEKEGNITSSWEEEGVESTSKNIHSDVLLNALALITFVAVSGRWSYESAASYGWLSFVFFVGISLPVAGIFLDRAIFSWIYYLQRKK